MSLSGDCAIAEFSVDGADSGDPNPKFFRMLFMGELKTEMGREFWGKEVKLGFQKGILGKEEERGGLEMRMEEEVERVRSISGIWGWIRREG